MRRLAILLAGILWGIPSAAQEPAPLEGSGPTPLLFLHPLVNYREDPRWVRDWERRLQSSNSLRVNVGSVSTDDFLTEIELHLTEPVASRLRILYDMRWFEAAHVEDFGQEHFLGLEWGVLDAAGLQLQVHPTSDKEEFDLRAGVVLTDRSREQYARLLVRWDDFLFEEKNDLGGTSDRVATSLEWTARGVIRAFEAFTRGRWGSTARRGYPDSTLSPELASDETGRNELVLRVRGLLREERFLELEYLRHEYLLYEVPRVSGTREGYENRIEDLALRVLWRLDDRWSVRGEIHTLSQTITASPSARYERSDLMPAVFVQWRPHPVHSIELGYMGTDYDTEWRDPDPPAEQRTEAGYVQKLELGWLIRFSQDARLQFSLSHEPDPQRFGGGNVQFLLFF